MLRELLALAVVIGPPILNDIKLFPVFPILLLQSFPIRTSSLCRPDREKYLLYLLSSLLSLYAPKQSYHCYYYNIIPMLS